MFEQLCSLILEIESLRKIAYEELEIPHLLEKTEQSSLCIDQQNLFDTILYIRENSDEQYINYATNLFNKFQFSIIKLKGDYEYLIKFDYQVHSFQKGIITDCLIVLHNYFTYQSSVFDQ